MQPGGPMLLGLGVPPPGPKPSTPASTTPAGNNNNNDSSSGGAPPAKRHMTGDSKPAGAPKEVGPVDSLASGSRPAPPPPPPPPAAAPNPGPEALPRGADKDEAEAADEDNFPTTSKGSVWLSRLNEVSQRTRLSMAFHE